MTGVQTCALPIFVEILKFQVIQKNHDQILVLLVVTDKFSNRTFEAVNTGLKSLIGSDIELKIEIKDDIPLLPSGKRRFIIREKPVKLIV